MPREIRIAGVAGRAVVYAVQLRGGTRNLVKEPFRFRLTVSRTATRSKTEIRSSTSDSGEHADRKCRGKFELKIQNTAATNVRCRETNGDAFQKHLCAARENSRFGGIAASGRVKRFKYVKQRGGRNFASSSDFIKILICRGRHFLRRRKHLFLSANFESLLMYHPDGLKFISLERLSSTALVYLPSLKPFRKRALFPPTNGLRGGTFLCSVRQYFIRVDFS